MRRQRDFRHRWKDIGKRRQGIVPQPVVLHKPAVVRRADILWITIELPAQFRQPAPNGLQMVIGQFRFAIPQQQSAKCMAETPEPTRIREVAGPFRQVCRAPIYFGRAPAIVETIRLGNTPHRRDSRIVRRPNAGIPSIAYHVVRLKFRPEQGVRILTKKSPERQTAIHVGCLRILDASRLKTLRQLRVAYGPHIILASVKIWQGFATPSRAHQAFGVDCPNIAAHLLCSVHDQEASWQGRRPRTMDGPDPLGLRTFNAGQCPRV